MRFGSRILRGFEGKKARSARLFGLIVPSVIKRRRKGMRIVSVQKRVLLSCLWLGWMCTPSLRAQNPREKNSSVSPLFGSGHGLDHVGIAVRDLEAAKKTYRDILGFTLYAGGKHPNGTRNSGPALETGYLELITFQTSVRAVHRTVRPKHPHTARNHSWCLDGVFSKSEPMILILASGRRERDSHERYVSGGRGR